MPGGHPCNAKGARPHKDQHERRTSPKKRHSSTKDIHEEHLKMRLGIRTCAFFLLAGRQDQTRTHKTRAVPPASSSASRSNSGSGVFQYSYPLNVASTLASLASLEASFTAPAPVGSIQTWCTRSVSAWHQRLVVHTGWAVRMRARICVYVCVHRGEGKQPEAGACAYACAEEWSCCFFYFSKLYLFIFLFKDRRIRSAEDQERLPIHVARCVLRRRQG